MKKNEEYAKREIKLATTRLEQDPTNVAQKDRLAYWSAYLGDFSTADEFATSDKTKAIIETMR